MTMVPDASKTVGSADASSDGGRDPVELLAEEFLARRQRGERPTIEEYVASHPELAEAIRAAFPALLMMEGLKGSSLDATGSVGSNPMAETPSTRPWRLGDYRILREIGRGGMGVVYEAEQVSLGRRVALKVMAGGALFDSRQVQRFDREARAAAKLHHTNIVPVFGVGHDEGQHYYVMQFIAGRGLDDILDEVRQIRTGSAGGRGAAGVARDAMVSAVARSLATGHSRASEADDGDATAPVDGTGLPASPSSDSAAAGLSGSSDSDKRYVMRVLRIGEQVADALAHAHSQGVLHRDIKPSNLLLDLKGDAWVTDFGLAKAAGDEDLTNTGDVVGTLRYMAPERFEGGGDARSDIYALGLTVYEMVALRPAFEARDRGLLIKQITEGAAAPVRQWNPRVPRDVETVIHKAMARLPRDRYQTAEALAEDLRRAAVGEPVQARRVSGAERAWRWAGRHPGLSTLAALLVLALAGGTTVSTVFMLRAKSEAARANREMVRSVDLAREAAAAASRELAAAEAMRQQRDRATRLFYAAETNLMYRDYEDGHFTEVQHRLAQLSPTGPASPDFRGFEWYYMQAACQPELRVLRGHAGRVSRVAFSPDGRRLVTWDWSNTTRLWDCATGQQIAAFPQQFNAFAFSPDSRRLATGGSAPGTLTVWDCETGREVKTVRTGVVMSRWMDYAPDNRRVATGSQGGGTRVWDVETGRLVLAMPENAIDHPWGRFMANGRRLATIGPDGSMRVWDAESGYLLATVPRIGRAPITPIVAENGRRFVTVDSSGVQVWDAETARAVATVRGDWEGVQSLALAADGRRFATGKVDGTARLWDAETGRELAVLRGHKTAVKCVSFAPDGTQLATASEDGTTRLWEAEKGAEIATLRGHEGRVSEIVFAADGRQLATASEDGTARLWDVEPAGRRQFERIVAVARDVRRIADRGADGVVRVWDVDTGRPISALHGRGQGISQALFASDGRRLVTRSRDGTVRFYDAESGRELATPRANDRGIVKMVSARNAPRLAVEGADGSIRVWDIETIRPLATLRRQPQPGARLAFTPDGRRLAVAAENGNGTVCDYDAETGRELTRFPAPVIRLPFGWTRHWQLEYAPDGRRLLHGDANGLMQVWDTETGREVAAFGESGRKNYGAAYSPDGLQLATGREDGTIRLWNAETGRELATLRGHGGTVRQITYFPDGRRLASAADDGTARLWDLETYRELATLPHEQRSLFGYGMYCSPDGLRLAETRSNGTTRVWTAQVWSASPVTDETRIRREALSLVRSLVRRCGSEAELRTAIARDARVSEQVRALARDHAGLYWDTHVRTRAEDLIAGLLAHARPRDELIAAIRADGSLTPEVRDRALSMAETWTIPAIDLAEASWEVLGMPGRDASAYRRALQLAEEACRIDPDYGDSWYVLGVAYFRCGRDAEALATLERSLTLHRGKVEDWGELEEVEHHWMFLTMVHERLGHDQEALAARERFKAAMARRLRIGGFVSDRSSIHSASTANPWREAEELLADGWLRRADASKIFAPAP